MKSWADKPAKYWTSFKHSDSVCCIQIPHKPQVDTQTSAAVWTPCAYARWKSLGPLKYIYLYTAWYISSTLFTKCTQLTDLQNPQDMPWEALGYTLIYTHLHIEKETKIINNDNKQNTNVCEYAYIRASERISKLRMRSHIRMLWAYEKKTSNCVCIWMSGCCC